MAEEKYKQKEQSADEWRVFKKTVKIEFLDSVMISTYGQCTHCFSFYNEADIPSPELTRTWNLCAKCCYSRVRHVKKHLPPIAQQSL